MDGEALRDHCPPTELPAPLGPRGQGPRGPAGRPRAWAGLRVPAPSCAALGPSAGRLWYLVFLCFISGVSFVFGFCL